MTDPMGSVKQMHREIVDELTERVSKVEQALAQAKEAIPILSNCQSPMDVIALMAQLRNRCEKAETDLIQANAKLANADTLLRKARQVAIAYTSCHVTQEINDTADVLLMGIDAHLNT